MKTLSLVIPTYNESGRLDKTIDALLKGFSFHGIKLVEIIFTDDGSTDKTIKKLQKYKLQIEKATNAHLRVISYKDNKGRGFALRHAAEYVTGDYMLYADADFSIPLSNLTTALPYIKAGVDVIVGSKKIHGSQELIKRSFLRRIVGYVHSFIAYVILGVFVWDFQGGFKLFSRKFLDSAFPNLKIDRWGFDMETIFLAKKWGYSIKEIPVVWSHVENGTKVRLFRDIYRSLYEMYRIQKYWLAGAYNRHLLRTSKRFSMKLT